MDIRIVPEFEEATTYLGDFPKWRLYMVNHLDFPVFALVSGEEALDGRKKKLIQANQEARLTMATAMKNAMINVFDGDRVDVSIISWGNPSPTAIYFLASSEDDRMRPAITSYGVDKLSPMSADDILQRSTALISALANEDIDFAAKL